MCPYFHVEVHDEDVKLARDLRLNMDEPYVFMKHRIKATQCRTSGRSRADTTYNRGWCIIALH